MKTITWIDIPEGTKALIYLCEYDYNTYALKVIHTLFFRNVFDAINSYANIPNPESQIAYETKEESFDYNLRKLHGKMKDIEWRKRLGDYL